MRHQLSKGSFCRLFSLPCFCIVFRGADLRNNLQRALEILLKRRHVTPTFRPTNENGQMENRVMHNPISFFSPVTEAELHERWKNLSLDRHSWAYCYSNGMLIRDVLAFLDKRPKYASELMGILDGEQMDPLIPDVSIHQLRKTYAVKYGTSEFPRWFRKLDLDKQRQVIQLTLNYRVPLPNDKEFKRLAEWCNLPGLSGLNATVIDIRKQRSS